MFFKYSILIKVQKINIFGNGEMLIQLKPLLEKENTCIEGIYDDFDIDNCFRLDAYKTKSHKDVLFCIGYKNMRKRYARYRDLKESGVDFVSYISFNAIIPSKLCIGNGTIINQGAIIDNYVTIGEAVFINIGAMISHHSDIKDNVFIAPGANIAGYVTVNEGVFIGANATIIDHINIGEYSVVAAGAVVTEDVPPYTMVAGNPAKVKKVLNHSE